MNPDIVAFILMFAIPFAAGGVCALLFGVLPALRRTRVHSGANVHKLAALTQSLLRFKSSQRAVHELHITIARLRERLWTKSLRRWYKLDFRWAYAEEVRIRDAPRLWFSLIDPCDHCGAVSVPIAEVYKCRVYARRHVENCPWTPKVESVLPDWLVAP